MPRLFYLRRAPRGFGAEGDSHVRRSGATAARPPGVSYAPVPMPEAFMLPPNDWIPNNDRLPVLLYRAGLSPYEYDLATRFEATFTRYGWPPRWRDGIYDFPHFHSTAHEALGIAQGVASVELGGPGARKVQLERGDVLVLPAGTAHCCLSASEDLVVVGAYPAGQQWDICRGPLSDAAAQAMRSLAVPDSDPLGGTNGPLTRLWGAR
ncbi:cupin (plasmid) [Mycetohabitans endofungorum]|uniref:cupin domain-containing protein n=1 Tax=Mycetohabitans endofungorum TaxID=417203 RepID=UPI002B061C2A|nr:cupin domain-containing protein [Mycetohabitans endofungorum]